MTFNNKMIALFTSAIALGASLVGVRGTLVHPRATAGGYVQTAGPGSASFTMYTGCNQPACGIAASGYTAAISQLAFGSAPGLGPGDACGRCFALTGTEDPYSPSYTGPFGKSIVVKVTDMCPVAGNEAWCGQTATSQTNQFNMPVQAARLDHSNGHDNYGRNDHKKFKY
ncbi:Endoglucanase V-like protein [Mycena venus]|uniref:Endoglucanase V-like protein n=1 Tax=Mycena venus TaxID=2733690 RepID=A0A8H7D314_9AGAR|nr:Endoglucanase V-like protein [Mycena venus]